MDEQKEHSVVVRPSNPAVEEWKRDGGTMDIIGVDYPKGRKPSNIKMPKAKNPKPQKVRQGNRIRNKKVGKYFVGNRMVSRHPIGRRKSK